MHYRCRTIRPSQSVWFDVVAERPEDAANDVFFVRDKTVPHVAWRIPGGPTVRFARVEVESCGEWIVRTFEHAIYRRGGVRPAGAPSTLAEVARELNWGSDPELLLEPGWDGEESCEDAKARR